MEQLLKSMTLEFFGSGKHKISPEKLLETENVLLLDVRTKEENASVSIKFGPHSNIICKNIPLDELPDRLSEIPENKFIAVFCPAHFRSSMAYVYLRLNGFTDVRILMGGYSALTEAVKPGKVLKVVQNLEP